MKAIKILAIIIFIQTIFASSQANFLSDASVLEFGITQQEAVQLTRGFLSGYLRKEVCEINDSILNTSTQKIFEITKIQGNAFKIPEMVPKLIISVVAINFTAKMKLKQCKEDGQAIIAEMERLNLKLTDPNAFTKVSELTTKNVYSIVQLLVYFQVDLKSRNMLENGKKMGELVRYMLDY